MDDREVTYSYGDRDYLSDEEHEDAMTTCYMAYALLKLDLYE